DNQGTASGCAPFTLLDSVAVLHSQDSVICCLRETACRIIKGPPGEKLMYWIWETLRQHPDYTCVSDSVMGVSDEQFLFTLR
ncbi:hypothetical protein DPMN_075301, partial [Dreissena polymorpha]